MIFYAQETAIGLFLTTIPVVLSLFFFFYSDKKTLSWILLFIGAFLLRLLMINLDPFLHEWDERYHALVAKNMMFNPFEPMLRVDRIYGEDTLAWCCSHIWLHKQPLFLWQMALSMKIFGVSLFALRLPSALMGTILVYFAKDIAHFWTKNKDIAYLTAFLCALTYFPLELISGYKSTDHNDVAFLFYVTASIWSFTHLVNTSFKAKWIIWTGIFVGCAVLNKWLTGLLIFGGWGLYILFDKELRIDLFSYLKVFISFLISCLVFVPWQLYAKYNFPVEYQREMEYNSKHIFEAVEGHTGDILYHWDYLTTFYGGYVAYVAILGFLLMFTLKKYDKRKVGVFFALVAVIYCFFSVIVATKMPAFTLPVLTLFITAIGVGTIEILGLVQRFVSAKSYTILIAIVFLILGYQFLQPNEIVEARKKDNRERNMKIFNDRVYKSLLDTDLKDKIFLNVKCDDELNLMFYKNVDAYCYYPKEQELDSLKKEGYNFVRFANFHPHDLNSYLENDKDVKVLEEEIIFR